MVLTLVLVVSAGIVLLGLYVFARHDDRIAVGASVVLAAAVLSVWFLSARDRDRLEEELRASQEKITELEAAPAQRGFTAEARALLVDALGDFVGPTAFVLANSSDVETTKYAREIVSVLNDAGWEVPPSFGMMYRPVLQPGQEVVPPGVILGISSEVPDPFANSIFNAFRDAGVDVTRGPHWPGTERPISILVGPSR
ncbi:MAG: hypothetical protein BMS9Abin37_2468 [Acidobacteriota bacterium]|nr:MAG: hypothetical protein BMS9Abin37_2468 [Acidobacteriota bacterium]